MAGGIFTHIFRKSIRINDLGSVVLCMKAWIETEEFPVGVLI